MIAAPHESLKTFTAVRYMSSGRSMASMARTMASALVCVPGVFSVVAGASVGGGGAVCVGGECSSLIAADGRGRHAAVLQGCP